MSARNRMWPADLLTFTGRVSRADIWWHFARLLPFLGLAILVWLGLDALSAPRAICWLASLAPYSVFLLGTIALQVRRLHDLGHSGWWMLAGPACLLVAAAIWGSVWGIAPWNGSLLTGLIWDAGEGTLSGPGWFLIAASAVFFCYLGFWPGQSTPNRFDR